MVEQLPIVICQQTFRKLMSRATAIVHTVFSMISYFYHRSVNYCVENLRMYYFDDVSDKNIDCKTAALTAKINFVSLLWNLLEVLPQFSRAPRQTGCIYVRSFSLFDEMYFTCCYASENKTAWHTKHLLIKFLQT